MGNKTLAYIYNPHLSQNKINFKSKPITIDKKKSLSNDKGVDSSRGQNIL